MVAPCAPHDDAGPGIDVDNLAVAIRVDDLQPVDPFVTEADEVDSNDIARSLGTHDIQNPGETLDFAVLVKIPRPVVIAVVILVGPRRERLSSRKPDESSHDKALEIDRHKRGISHIKAVNRLTAKPPAPARMFLSANRLEFIDAKSQIRKLEEALRELTGENEKLRHLLAESNIRVLHRP
ncbi:MAG: hypothetical protein AB1440_10545 [Pseudomonadota bacterium]